MTDWQGPPPPNPLPASFIEYPHEKSGEQDLLAWDGEPSG